MKEEEWRDYLTLGLINDYAALASTGPAKRYSLSEILDVKESYRANPGGLCVGQFVFAMDCCRSQTLIGQCTCGCVLVPWGLCCNMQCYVNSACSCITCVACSFCLGDASSIYLALGSMGGCGATIWRRIC